MKYPWEMTQTEFLRLSPSKRKPSQTRTETERTALKVAVKIGNQVYVGGNGEIHAQVILRENLPVERVITGYVDCRDCFYYQYPEHAHRLEVEDALARGLSVPWTVLSSYPDLFSGLSASAGAI